MGFKQTYKTHRAMLKLIAVIFIFVCAFGVILGFLYLKNKPDKATIIMTMNYENSSSGLNPDGSKFNLRYFKCDEVLDEALNATNMSDHLTENKLASFIHIKEVTQKPIDVESDIKYINSTYKIYLSLPKEHSQYISAETLLTEICEAYKDWFVENYVVDSQALVINVDNTKDMDYSRAANYLDMVVTRGKNYLSQKEESTSAFIGEDGSTWKSLRQELSNLTEYDMKTFNQYVWENGISKDRSWATTLLTRQNEDLRMDYQLLIANADTCGIIVNEYRKEMTVSALIPTYDDQSQFYMSRTKTGIDEISKSMDEYLGYAAEIKETIDLNSDKIMKLNSSAVESNEKADKMLLNIQNEVVDIFSRIKKLDEEYMREKTDAFIQYSIVEQKLPFF